MLVLSRKENEQIVIDGNVVVTVLDIRKGRVRLGIDAPRHVPVHREPGRPPAECAKPEEEEGVAES